MEARDVVKTHNVQDHVMSMALGFRGGQIQLSTRSAGTITISLVILGKLLNLSFSEVGILLVPASQDYT